MQLKTYIFLFRNNGTLRCLSNALWQQQLERKKPFFNTDSQQFTVGEIQIEKPSRLSSSVRSVYLWDVSINKQGFVERAILRTLNGFTINARLDQLFQLGGIGLEGVLMDFIGSLIKDSGPLCSVPPVQLNDEEYYIDQLLTDPCC